MKGPREDPGEGAGVNRRGVPPLFAALALLAALHAPGQAAGQSVGLGLTHIWTGTEAVGDHFGGGVSLKLGAVEVAGTVYAWSHDDFGRPCGGLIPPDCFEEPLEVDASLVMVGLGVPVSLFRAPRLAFGLVPEAGLAFLHRTDVGVESGRDRTGEGGHVYVAGAIGASAAPFREVPLTIRLRVGLGGTAPIGADWCSDCYQPFNHGFRFTRASVTALYGF